MDDYNEYSSGTSALNNDVYFLSNMNLDPNAKNYSNCDILGSFYDITPSNYNEEKYTAFGYEKDNGDVSYVLSNHMTKDDIKKSQYLKTRTTPTCCNQEKTLIMENYFDKEIFSKEKTDFRVLFKLDGSIVLSGAKEGEYEAFSVL